MRIPKRFKLLGHTITVSVEDGLEHKHACYGEARYVINQISLQKPHPGFAESQAEKTFCHELTHMLLYYAGTRGKDGYLHEDEDVVELLASLMHQALSTAEYGKE